MKDNEKLIKGNKLKLFLLYFRSLIPFLLAHHPDCDEFKGHTLNIGKHRFCIGCFVGYTTAILGVIIIGSFKLYMAIPHEYFLIFGLIFLASFFLSPLNLTDIKIIKIFQKFLIGLSGSFIFWYIALLPNPGIYNFYLVMFVFNVLLTGLNIYHVMSVYNGCKKCEHVFNWSNCPGFEKIRNNFIRHNIPNLFEGLNEFSETLKEKKANNL